MPFTDPYRRQVSLLVRILPRVAKERCFALKGGTAINLFVRAMPRLSVDIDLTYLPLASRQESLAAIDAAMRRIANEIRHALPRVRINATGVLPEKATTKLLVRHDDAQIKIEVTPVLRGCVYEPELRAVSPAVEAAFGFAEIQVVSFADLYMPGRSSPLSTASIRAIFSMYEICSLTKASMMQCAGHSWSTSSATIAPWPSCLCREKSPSHRNSFKPSRE